MHSARMAVYVCIIMVVRCATELAVSACASTTTDADMGLEAAACGSPTEVTVTYTSPIRA